MAVVKITELEKLLRNRIDTEDLVQVEKVERYIHLVKTFRRMNTAIRKEGESVSIKNGAQEYTKAHPLIAERNKVNTQLLSIERSFGFEGGNPTKSDGPGDPSDLI
ncbi:Phage terminase, small subunit [Halobacillus karajensis]|uniref:P27 family phage terminase small subunit n=1 Tax=Halobacillus karajensis TaxID=195088 RepID=UPI0005502026|nr:P27 family phage terminase small subunit [Halobacillus karajensis]SEH78285.1 Phage terminase, small subunit [Halobacillus karajensis]